jgi:FMN reductase
VRVLALDGSPQGGGRTDVVLRAVLAACEAQGAASTAVLGLADEAGLTAALEAVGEADAFVLGSPVYRASYATPMKAFLDRLPRGMWGETTAPVTGRAVALVCTGATWHHYLALDGLRSVMSGFFAAHVLTPGLYVPREGFDDDGALTGRLAGAADATGRGLVELARAVAASEVLGAVRPQA